MTKTLSLLLAGSLLTNSVTFAYPSNSVEIYTYDNLQHNSVVEEVVVSAEENLYTDEYYDVPNINTSFKTYMSYKTITNKSSKQYKLQQTAYTDEHGFRKVGEFYCVAMGTYYSNNVGDRFHVTLDTGREIDVIIGDVKQDVHTDSENMYVPINGNMLEFIVDTDVLSSEIKKRGTVSYLEQFKGNIKEIKKYIEIYYL